MINFIVCEKNLSLMDSYVKIIEKELMNNDIQYNIKCYSQYSEIKNSNDMFYKVFIFGNKNNCIETIKYIREELDDWQSMIIIINNDLELKHQIIENRLLVIDFIESNSYFKERLSNDIKIVLKNYDKRPNKLKYTYKHTLYNIDYSKIIYIEKELDNKRCVIHTNNKDFYFPGNLCKIEKILDNRFAKCSKSHIINIEQVESYNIKTNIMTMSNKIKLDIVSRNKKKEIKNILRNKIQNVEKIKK